MDAELYRAAELGDWDAIQKFGDQIYIQRTKGGNTVLHLVALCCDSADAVQQILETEPRLIYERNAKSETALHLAARKGHCDVVKGLLSFAKGHESWLTSGDARCCEMLWTTNKEGNTALHEAVRYNFYDVVKLLVEESHPFSYPNKSLNIYVLPILFIPNLQYYLGGGYFFALRILGLLEDGIPGFRYRANFAGFRYRAFRYRANFAGFRYLANFAGFRYRANLAGESPLYLALVNEFYGIAEMILSNFNSPSFDGPGRRTALHAAALGKFPECKEVLELMLEKLPQLTKEVDTYGWTALHYAAKFNQQEVASLLLCKDKSMAYISAYRDGSKTALHIAVIHGHVGVMQEILSHCPDCWEMITDEGWNMLHLAVKNEQKQVLEFILQKSWAADLINQKDVNGNTPLHLYVATETLQGHNLVNYPCLNRNATNDAGLTPLDTITQSDEVTDRQKAIKGELEQIDVTQRNPKTFIIKKKVEESKDAENWARISGPPMIVATLIVTVTFAAGFTLPGGYEQDSTKKGTAVLVKNVALTLFVIFDSAAMMLAMAAMFHLFFIHHRPNLWKDTSQLLYSRFCILYAMISMVIAFVSGLYAVLPVLGIRIYLCVIGAILCLPIILDTVIVHGEIERKANQEIEKRIASLG